MNFRDFKIGWRLLIKEPSYSAIVILGLSVGIAACFLLLGLVRHQLSYDAHIAENDKIFYVKERWHIEGFNGWNGGTSFQARKALVDSGLPLFASVYSTHDIDVRYGERVQSISLSIVDPDFKKIFGIKPLSGDLDAAIKRPDAMALTEESAIKLFGNTDVIGKTILVDGTTYTVTALLATPPTTTAVPYEAIAGIENTTLKTGWRRNAVENWGSSNGPVFVKALADIKPETMKAAIQGAIRNSSFFEQFLKPLMAANGNNPELIEFKLGKLRDRNLDPDLQGSTLQDPKMLAGLTAIAILILLLAMTNYLNLATVRALRRQREIAMRKVLGASASRVLQQFFSESILVCMIAAGFGLLVAWLVLPMFSDMVALQLDSVFSWQSVILTMLASILLGLASGAYPAWSALKVLPTAALSGRGNVETAGGLKMRRVLTVLQFGTAMGLTATAIAVAWQTFFISHLNQGFDPKPLVVVNAPSGLATAEGRSFKDALVRIPGVTKVTVTNSQVRDLHNGDSVSRDGQAPVNLRWLAVNQDFFLAHNIQAKAGRLFDEAKDPLNHNSNSILNESAVRKLGFRSNEEAIGTYIKRREESSQIIGVVPDIRNTDPRNPPPATFYFLDAGGGTFTIRTEGSKEQLQTAIEAIWSRYFPNAMLRMETMEASFDRSSASERHIAELLTAASMITIAIAAFGIYVLAAYSVQRRTKEIVLRKLYGASRMEIGKMVGREFLILIGIGALIGLPFAYYQIQKYLADFQDKAPIGAWTIFGALLVGCLVALLSTFRHTVGAIRIAPVQVLRD